MNEFIAHIHHVNVFAPTSDLAKIIIRDFCVTLEAPIKLQCDREYGFDNDGEIRATVIANLNEAKLESFPTNELIAERDFSRFNRLAKTANSRNRIFKAKNIRNNVTLHNEICSRIDKISKVISKILSNRKKFGMKTKIKKCWKGHREKLKKVKRANIIAEGCYKIVKHDLDLVQVLRNYTWLHKPEKVLRSELFRLAGIAHDEKLENLLILLQGEDASSSFTVANLPTNAEAVTELPQNMATEAIDKLNDRTQ